MSSKQFFNEIAGSWDEMRSRIFSDNLREKALDLAGVKSGALAADIGAGSGFITEALLKRGARVIAVDQSEPMIIVMKSKFGADAEVNYRVVEGDRLPLTDACVDYVFANMYLHHVEDPPAAIMEMARILRPMGRLVISDADAHNFEFLREEHHDRWLGFDRADIDRWFVSAGLHNVLIKDAEEKCHVESCAKDQLAVINIFLAGGEK